MMKRRLVLAMVTQEIFFLAFVQLLNTFPETQLLDRTQSRIFSYLRYFLPNLETYYIIM